jgi:hypothetical protein
VSREGLDIPARLKREPRRQVFCLKNEGSSIQNDLLALAEADRRIIKAVVETDWEGVKAALPTYQALRKKIRTRLLDEVVTSIDEADAVAILRKITTGEGLQTDEVLNHLSSASLQGQPPEEFSEDELRTLGLDLFYSWFSHYEYVTGLAELRPLVVRGSVAESVSRLVRQVKNCYAFQQFDAAYNLCRTVIEASIRDICVQCQLFPDLGENVILYEKFNWSQLRDKVSSGLLREQLSSLYRDLSAALHARKSVSKDEVLRAFESTLQIVEELYAAHRL